MADRRDAGFWAEAEAVFAAVLERAPGDRAATLARLTAGREDLRREVAALLEAHQHASIYLPDLEPIGASGSPRVDSGARIGPFTLVEAIGAGGMGRVFRATRTDGGFDQTVAIKLIDAPMRDAEAARRFRAERQILADLHHPNIVTLLDGGITTDGQAYLVMEYVDGVPLTAFCRGRSLRARLDLVRQVCRALQHAHQHLVVHRDLKPANILVTPDGIAKVLDFGIAKLLEASDAAAAPLDAVTRVEARALTPNYASPEQVRGLPASPASDVYSIGVILFEVLTGRRPYETAATTLDETLQIVLERDPPRPSAATGDATLPYRLRQLRGDLDAIVLRALRKEPVERYDSAGALSDDLDRYLRGQPVNAREPTLAYMARKLGARHRAAFATAALSLVVILALSGVSAWSARAARRERDRARAEATKASEIARFLSAAFANANPVQARGQTVTARDLLDRGTASIAQLDGQPDVQASLLLTMADAYNRLSRLPQALELAERALALREGISSSDGAELADALQAVGSYQRRAGHPAAAAPILARALSMRERVLGRNHPAVAETLRDLALATQASGGNGAREMLARAAAILEHAAPRSTQLALIYNNLASMAVWAGDIDTADRMYQQSIAVYAQTTDAESWGVAMPLLNLASILRDREGPADLSRAEALLRRALAIDEQTFGPSSANVAYALAALGDLAAALGDPQTAHAQLERSLEMYAHTREPDDVELVAPNQYLGRVLMREGRAREALPLFERALRISERNHSATHPEVAEVLVDVARCHLALGEPAAAAPLLRRAIEIQHTLPPDHPAHVATLTVSGALAARERRLDDAQRDLARAVAIARARLAPTNTRRRDAEAALLALDQGRRP